jgi:hypothetical protein
MDDNFHLTDLEDQAESWKCAISSLFLLNFPLEYDGL